MDSESAILERGGIVIDEAMRAPNSLSFKVAGAMGGNMWQENWIKPDTPPGQRDHNSRGSMQWRNSGADPWDRRLDNLMKVPDWDTLPAQVRFFKWECRNNPRFTRSGKSYKTNATITAIALPGHPHCRHNGVLRMP
jgi:hypothetical protein